MVVVDQSGYISTRHTDLTRLNYYRLHVCFYQLLIRAHRYLLGVVVLLMILMLGALLIQI